MSILALDVGGTTIKYRIFDNNCNPLTDVFEQPTPKTAMDNQIMDAIKKIVVRMGDSYAVDGVAISTAGVVDAERGTVDFAGPTIPGYSDTPIKKIIEETFDIPCEVENDVNCAALGEFWSGSGKGSDSIACITIGTGVGGAIILNGNIWRGATHSAGEVGYLLLPEGEFFQDKASASALVKNYSALSGISSEQLNGKYIFNKAQQGEAQAVQAIDEMITAISQGLLAIVYLINPDMIVVGGGVAAQKEYIEHKISEKMQALIISDRFMPKQIVCASLGNNAGMVGALYHFKNKHPEVM